MSRLLFPYPGWCTVMWSLGNECRGDGADGGSHGPPMGTMAAVEASLLVMWAARGGATNGSAALSSSSIALIQIWRYEPVALVRETSLWHESAARQKLCSL